MIIKFNSLIKTNAKLRLFSQMLLKKLKKSAQNQWNMPIFFAF